MSEILRSIQYPDLEVCEDLRHGLALLQVETLSQLALPIRTSLLGRFRPSNDDEVAARLCQVTLQEAQDGSLLPAVPLEEVPHDVVVSPRFPVIQGPKLRAIDDMSASMINATVGSHEKLQFYAVAREFCNASGRPLHGRSFGMQNAYRQIPVLPAHRRLAYVAHFCPSAGRPLAFAMNCMPFGGAASVYAFARTAMALQRILTQVFWVVITNYLDDYVPFSDVALTSKVIRTVFHVLGFVLSTNPKKDHPFAETFTALGVEFLLHDTPTSLAVRNTAALVKSCSPSCVRFCTPIASQPDNCSPSDPGCVLPRPTCTAVGVCVIKQMSVVEGFTQTSPRPCV